MTSRARHTPRKRPPPDPALVDLVRALAIDAARRDHAREMTQRAEKAK